jgi:phage terminase small subunit
MAKYTPRGLTAEAQRLYRETVKENGLDVIDDAASLALLENACRALMRLREAEGAITKEGSTVADRFGQLKPHPAVARVDAEGLAFRHSLAQIRNHSEAAAWRRICRAKNGSGGAEPQPKIE